MAKALSVFLLPPFIFARFDPEEAAVWLIFITLQGMQLLIASSTDQPIVRGFAYALGGATQVRDMRNVDPSAQRSANMALFSRVWGASSFTHVVIGVATLALLWAMGVWSAAPLIDKTGAAELWLALAAFVLGGAIRAYGGKHVSYLIGVDRIPLLRWWEAAFWGLTFLSALASLLLGGGLLAIALAYQIPLMLNIGWNAWLCRRDQRERAGFVSGVRMDREILAQLWPSIWRTGVGTFVGAIIMPAAALGYVQKLDATPASALLYFISVALQLGRFSQVPFSVTLPQLARMQAQGEREAQVVAATKATALCYMLHGALSLLFAIFLYFAYRDTLLDYISLWFLFAAAGLAERISSIHAQWYATTNHVIFHWLNTASAGLFVLFLYLLLPTLQASAFPMSQLGYLLFLYIPATFFYTLRQFRVRFLTELFIGFPLLLTMILLSTRF